MWLIDKSYVAMVDGPLMRKAIIVPDFPAYPVGRNFKQHWQFKALVFTSGIGCGVVFYMGLLALCILIISPESVRLQ